MLVNQFNQNNIMNYVDLLSIKNSYFDEANF